MTIAGPSRHFMGQAGHEPSKLVEYIRQAVLIRINEENNLKKLLVFDSSVQNKKTVIEILKIFKWILTLRTRPFYQSNLK